ncbi:MAG TPA: EAL domain-containing response regulator [Usitatibacteraceae bacterium]|nr:EAL domain-containing response regulator [Usitatibacteraceae bacterium]
MDLGKLRFLIVDDHGFQRWEMARLLTEIGAAHVFEAEDGQAALDLLSDLAEPIDIVITDLNMPEMDGMELARHVGELGKRSAMILCSALDKSVIDSVGTMVEMYGIPLLGVIEKPTTAGKLEATIARYDLVRGALREVDVAQPIVTLAEIEAGLKGREFLPFFQPKVELATLRVVGAEALARWRHPRLGIITASEFARTMEENGTIEDLTWIILSQSAQACAEWHHAGIPISVAVNISQVSLGNVDLAEQITACIEQHRLEPRHLLIEITESATAVNVRHAIENLARLRMRGFRLSIDDYGTGYSSMQQLTRIAFNELKIDRSFISHCGAAGSDRVVLESSLEIARRLNLVSVAEGIETREEFRTLKELGCDQGQGYFFARPMKNNDFVAWVKAWPEIAEAMAA